MGRLVVLSSSVASLPLEVTLMVRVSAREATAVWTWCRRIFRLNRINEFEPKWTHGTLWSVVLLMRVRAEGLNVHCLVLSRKCLSLRLKLNRGLGLITRPIR